MTTSEELAKIKKVYGERFMKMCRGTFPTILEKEGVLYKILTSSFENNGKSLYEDLCENSLEGSFKGYIYDKFKQYNDVKNMKIETYKTPYELLNEAGYELVECKTEEEIQAFKKYYREDEELCTFKGNVLDRCIVFFAVKKDVDNIKRENFENPKREDEYGTSVMSIQFTRDAYSTVSIKNRYNHTVDNPDATFGNNLDRITPGLTQSFGNLLMERGQQLSNKNVDKFEIPGYVKANDGKFYKYNLVINGNYYCPGNILIDYGDVVKFENPEKQMVVDYFLIDREMKIVKMADYTLEDSFIDDLKNIEKIDVVKDNNGKSGEKIITIQKKNKETPIKITINKNNEIIGYENEDVQEVGDSFLTYNKVLETLNFPNLECCGDSFLYNNKKINELELPKLKTVGGSFMYSNEQLKKLELPMVTSVKESFLYKNLLLENLELPSLEQVGNNFLFCNSELKNVILPKLTKVGNSFIYENKCIEKFEARKLENVGDCFLKENRCIEKLELPNLKEVGFCFLDKNVIMNEIEVPNLMMVRSYFLSANNSLKKLELPNLIGVMVGFLKENSTLEKIEVPKMEQNVVMRSLIEKILKRNAISKEIAKLDKENNITSSEIAWAKGKVDELSKEIEDNKENEMNEER